MSGDGEPSFGFGDASPVPLPPTFAWAKSVAPGNHDPVFAQFIDGTWTSPIVIASDPGDDLAPRWWQDAAGTVHTTWWRRGANGEEDAVVYASRPLGASVFSTPERVSLPGESARAQALAVHPTGEIYIAYEALVASGERRIVIATKSGPSSAFQTEVIAPATSLVPAGLEVRTAAGHTWAIWVDSVDRVGYSELIEGTWSAPAYEIYSTELGAERTRMGIRSTIINR